MTKKLPSQQFKKARSFLKNHARPLDWAMFAYQFESGSKEDVLDALQAYQNEDGGFGNAIEPDFRCQESSAIGTSVALQYLSALGIHEDHPMIQSAIGYLLDIFQDEQMGWELAPPAVNEAPHAPWWKYRPLTDNIVDWANPGAEILGYFHEYKGLVDPAFLHDLTEYALHSLEQQPEQMEMHNLLCFLRLEKRLPEPEKQRVRDKLVRAVPLTVTTNPKEWDGYCLLPLEVITSPKSHYMKLFEPALIEKNLDRIIATQAEDGSWQPSWSWGRDETAWSLAEREWKGYLTRAQLNRLRAFVWLE